MLRLSLHSLAFAKPRQPAVEDHLGAPRRHRYPPWADHRVHRRSVRADAGVPGRHSRYVAGPREGLADALRRLSALSVPLCWTSMSSSLAMGVASIETAVASAAP